MCSIKQIKELAERNAVYEFEKKAKMYGKEYIRYYYNKLAELNGSINSTCNCQHNSNSRDNEPCCRCNSKPTNADRIRNMSDEELAEFIHKMEATCFVDIIGYANKDCGQGTISCRECRAKAPTILEWLQSETKVEESEGK